MPPDFRERFAHSVNGRFFYGWLMVVVAMAGYFASGPGQSHIFSVFILPLSRDLGLDQTQISSAYALATLAAAFGLPYIGRLIDRYGMRRVVLITTTLLGFAAIAFGRVQGLIMLCLLFGALRFLGQGTLMLSSSNLVAQWFSKKRGFAASLVALGFSASVAFHPPLAQWLIDQVGWRDAWLWLGIMTWAIYLPLVFFLVQNKPEDIGLTPDGDRTAISVDKDGVAISDNKTSSADVGLTSGEALRTTAFWITAIALASFSHAGDGSVLLSSLDLPDPGPERADRSQGLSDLGDHHGLLHANLRPHAGPPANQATIHVRGPPDECFDDRPYLCPGPADRCCLCRDLRHEQWRRACADRLCLAALLRTQTSGLNPGNSRHHHGRRRLDRPAPLRRGLRCHRQLSDGPLYPCRPAGAVRDRRALHASAGPTKDVVRLTTE